MARSVRDNSLETRAARSRLKARTKPYWRSIERGAHIGYRRGPRGGAWIARYFLGSGRYAEAKVGTADDVLDADGTVILSFPQAQAVAREWFAAQARKAAGLEDAQTANYTVADTIRDYLEWYEAHRKAKREVEYRANAYILPDLGQRPVAALTAKELSRWHQGIAASGRRVRASRARPARTLDLPDDPEAKRRRRHTANKMLTVLKAALNRAWHEGKVPSDDAWRRVKPFRHVDVPRVRHLSADECRRLVNACEPQFRDLVRAALLTGCRYGELSALQCDDFDSDSKTIHVRMSKSGKPRRVPLNEDGVAFFTRMVAGRTSDESMFLRRVATRRDGSETVAFVPWRKSDQNRPLAKAAKAAKVENVSFHILRHTYGSMLAMAGVPLGVIAAALGHSDTRITERHYAALAPSYIAETIRANLPKLGIVEVNSIVVLSGSRRTAVT